jgi:hypothetical protein
MARRRTPPAIETAVLVASGRRCALCFHLSGDLSEKNGQIAHLDQDPSNSAEDNLAFLCLDHHSEFDSKTKQHKNYTIHEVKAARQTLYAAIASGRHTSSKNNHGQEEQRARLTMFIPPDASEKTAQFQPGQWQLEILFIMPAIRNYGKTEARITKGTIRLEQRPAADPMPPEPQYDARDAHVFNGEVVLPPESSAQLQSFRVGISNLDFKPVREGLTVLWIYGFVEYRDIYDQFHENRFCFTFHIPGGFDPQPAGWYRAGPPGYNTST